MSEEQIYKYSPYSASKIGLFDDCPYKFKLQYIDKIEVPYVPKPFFEKGSFIHYVLENYPNKPEKPFKFELSTQADINKYKEIVKNILKSNNIKQYLHKECNREDYFKITEDIVTGSINKNILFRGYIDYYVKEEDTAIIVDWKSGKVYENKSEDQLKIYALWIFLHDEKINKVKCSYYYVEHDVEHSYIYNRNDLKKIIEYFLNKISIIENTENFEKKPNRNCKYCDFFQDCQPQNIKLGVNNGKMDYSSTKR